MLRTYIPMAAKPLEDIAETPCMELGRWYLSLANIAPLKDRKVTALNRAIDYFERYLQLHEKPDIDRVKASGQLDQALGAVRKLRGVLTPMGSVLIVTFEKRTLSTSGGKKYFTNAVGKRLRGQMVGGSLTAGRAGAAMKFDGKAHVDFGNPKDLQITGAQTICMWVKPANLSARQNPMNKAFGGEGTWTIELSGAVTYFCGSAGKNASPYGAYSMSSPLKSGKWSHIAVVRDAKAGKVTWYKDGQLVKSYKLRHSIAASKNSLLLGKGYVRNYQGLMDEVAIFNRALTGKEIKTIFQTGQRGLTLN